MKKAPEIWMTGELMFVYSPIDYDINDTVYNADTERKRGWTE